jgi:hypothetical protein
MSTACVCENANFDTFGAPVGGSLKVQRPAARKCCAGESGEAESMNEYAPSQAV